MSPHYNQICRFELHHFESFCHNVLSCCHPISRNSTVYFSIHTTQDNNYVTIGVRSMAAHPSRPGAPRAAQIVCFVCGDLSGSWRCNRGWKERKLAKMSGIHEEGGGSENEFVDISRAEFGVIV